MAEIRLEKFKFEHMAILENAVGEVLMPPSEAVQLERHPSFSGFVGDKLIGCAGVVKLWPKRWHAWAHISTQCKPHVLSVVRNIRAFCDMCDGRIEAVVLEDFPVGDKFARACGFVRETPEPMRHYFANGKGAYMYARVSD